MQITVNCYLLARRKPEFTHLFSLQVEKARNDELKHWENDPKATLALIILQDQFVRSLYKVCELTYQNRRLKGIIGNGGSWALIEA